MVAPFWAVVGGMDYKNYVSLVPSEIDLLLLKHKNIFICSFSSADHQLMMTQPIRYFLFPFTPLYFQWLPFMLVHTPLGIRNYTIEPTVLRKLLTRAGIYLLDSSNDDQWSIWFSHHLLWKPPKPMVSNCVSLGKKITLDRVHINIFSILLVDSRGSKLHCWSSYSFTIDTHIFLYFVLAQCHSFICHSGPCHSNSTGTTGTCVRRPNAFYLEICGCRGSHCSCCTNTINRSSDPVPLSCPSSWPLPGRCMGCQAHWPVNSPMFSACTYR